MDKEKLLIQAIAIRDAHRIAENTAVRVGALLVDIINSLIDIWGEIHNDVDPDVISKLDKKLDKSVFDELFEKVNLGTEASPDWAIKAKYGLFTERFLSAKGLPKGSGGSIGASALYELSDVELTSPAEGNVLQYIGGKWVNSAISAGLDETALSKFLTDNNYAKLSDIHPVDLSEYIKRTTADSLYQPKGDYASAASVKTVSDRLDDFLTGSDTDNIINKWKELEGFLSGMSETDNLATLLSGKVDKRTGYGLSKNDFTDTLLAKLNGIAEGANKYVLPVAKAAVLGGVMIGSTLTASAAGVLDLPALHSAPLTHCKVTVDRYGRVTSGASLAESDIPSLSISKITGLQNALDRKLDKSVFDDLFEKVNIGTSASPVWAIKAKHGLFTERFLSAKGRPVGDGSGSSGGVSYDRLDNWVDYSAAKAGYVLSAKLGHELYLTGNSLLQRVSALEAKPDIDLSPYVTLATPQTITGQKTFASDICFSASSGNLRKLYWREVGYGDKFGIWPLFSGIDDQNKMVIGSAVGAAGTDPEMTAKITIALKSGDTTFAGRIIKSGGTASQFLMANGSLRTARTRSTVGDLAWTTQADGDGHIPTISQLAFWNGAYAGTASNLRYCWRGQFGDIVTHSASEFLTSHQALDHINNLGNLAAVSGTTTAPSGLRLYSVYNNGYPCSYGNLLRIGGSGAGELLLGWTDDNISVGRIYYRSKRDMASTAWSGWAAVAYLSDVYTRGDADAKYVTALGTSGDQLTWAKNGAANNITIPYAVKASSLKSNSTCDYADQGVSWFDGDLKAGAAVQANDSPTSAWWHILRFNHSNTNAYYTDLAVPFNDNSICYKIIRNGVVAHGKWVKVIDELNCGSILDGRYINASGDTMTGALNFANNTANIVGDDVQFGDFNGSGQIGIQGVNGNTGLAFLKKGDAWGSSATRWAMTWDGANMTASSAALFKNLNADLLDGSHESDFFKKARTGMTTAYVDLTSYSPNATGYANYSPGTYMIARSGYSELVVHFALNAGSTSALQLRTNYGDADNLMYRKTTDSNRVSGPWRKIVTELNIGSYNAGSATRLATSRAIWGHDFNGTGNVNGCVYIQADAGDYREGIRIKPYGDWSTVVLGGNDLTADTGTSAASWSILNNNGKFYINRGGAGTHTGYELSNTNGNWGVGRMDAQYKLDVAGSIIADSWIRTRGATGWYNETYGGGWCMTDTTWIRTHNNKSVYSGSGQIRSDYAFNRDGVGGTSWNKGHGAYNVAIVSNNQQTPLLLAYRQGSALNVEGANRLFAMEFLNNGTNLRFCFGGSSKVEFWSSGDIHAVGSVWGDKAVSAKGLPTSSDERLKTGVRDVILPWDVLLKAPSMSFLWRDDPAGGRRGGTIAQYWERRFKEVVYTRPDGYLAVDYGVLAHVECISLAHHMDDELTRLKKRVEVLERENKELRQLIRA